MMNNKIQKPKSLQISSPSSSTKRIFDLLNDINDKATDSEKAYKRNLRFQIFKSVPEGQSASDLITDRFTELAEKFAKRIEYLESCERDQKWKFFIYFFEQKTGHTSLIPDVINHEFWYTDDALLKQALENMGMGNANLTCWSSNIYDTKKNLELTTLELIEFVFLIHEEMEIEEARLNNKSFSILGDFLRYQLRKYDLCQESVERTIAVLNNKESKSSDKTSSENLAQGLSNKGISVLERFKAKGIKICDVQKGDKNLKKASLILDYYIEQWSFTIEEIYPKGGQIFICSTKNNGNEIFEYYNDLRSLAGRHLYRSRCGKVIAQLNRRLSAETGLLFQQILSTVEL